MLRAFLTVSPWDLIDEDAGNVLDRLHGEVGITGVSLWAACRPMVQIRAHEVEPRIIRTRGGLLFHPDERHYAATRCKPIMSEWVKTRHPLKRIVEACAERAMELRLAVSASLTGRLAERHPEMACKNVFGSVSRMALCLTNPDVRAYLGGLVSDLSARESVAGVTITDFTIAWAEAFGSDLHGGLPLGCTDRTLLAMCFCESCHQRAVAAGVDVEMARRSVQTHLQRTLDSGCATDLTFHAILADNVPLTAYHRWRTDELSSLLEQLVDSCTCELLLDRCLDDPSCRTDGEINLALPAAVITQLDHPDLLGAALSVSARRNELRLPEGFAVGSYGPQLVTTLSRAVELGIAGVEIDAYGVLPEAALVPIKQAIRFARRATD